ncbi:unnamed protein product [Cuscuta epithymum]|uniref:Non-specific serine/threonine protein kinase n=1 Tax=Cuscuta epithymum TaxID=186058 RepID=A0AAV0EWK9_9ASTE|nr:unnamed protein product [Cuscuta epithymum]
MNLTAQSWLTSWKSSNDPSVGRYSLQLLFPTYGELALVYNDSNANNIYWYSGNWTGNAFARVPRMAELLCIKDFIFSQPFTLMASLMYSEMSIEHGVQQPLTHFHLDHTGQLKQYTWYVETENWNIVWSTPKNPCSVYGFCGNMGFCDTSSSLSPCKCITGFEPRDDVSWDAGDFSSGCRLRDGTCGNDNGGFQQVRTATYGGARSMSFTGTMATCKKRCLGNCSCLGFHYNEGSRVCTNMFGELLNMRNSFSTSDDNDELFLRVKTGGVNAWNDNKKKTFLLIGASCFVVMVTFVLGLSAFFILRRKILGQKTEEDKYEVMTNLKLFSHHELHDATKGFSEKLGQGGCGAVFLGNLPDSSRVAVKRLDRAGGSEKEFRAEISTLGNIQHINLVRLRGYCCEDNHRILVYDYMPNGPLSSYLSREGGKAPLPWDVRFRVAVGVARGLAYLHEDCRSCIVHRDIKPENILVDGDFCAKVSDFGLAKLLCGDLNPVPGAMGGTQGYVAPEVASGSEITAKADVYSYGMTMLELIGGRRNVEGPPPPTGGNEDEKWFFPPWAAQQIIEGNLAAVVDQKLAAIEGGGGYNASEAERLGRVAVWCIQEEESARPTMGTVLKMLQGVAEVGLPPMPPNMHHAFLSDASSFKLSKLATCSTLHSGEGCDILDGQN